ncbi:bactofilin family protein [Halothiobacillus diazotrophicus]|uniref:bactofilin family protein n=1 Tax=Halothiobacillus diazotrophicus TaxID=1860122 RepID=UPI003899669E
MDGLIDGHLHVAQTITIGKEGRLYGNANTEHLFVAGEFVGLANCRQLTILPGGRFNGELSCESLTIEDGGRFEGNCTHKSFLPTPVAEPGAPEDASALDRARDNSHLLQNQS